MAVSNGISPAAYLLVLCFAFLFNCKLLRQDGTECKENSIVNPSCLRKALKIQNHAIYIMKYCYRPQFLSGKILYTKTGISTCTMQKKLLSCGDLPSNPGKKGSNSKHYCMECCKKVMKSICYYL